MASDVLSAVPSARLPIRPKSVARLSNDVTLADQLVNESAEAHPTTTVSPDVVVRVIDPPSAASESRNVSLTPL